MSDITFVESRTASASLREFSLCPIFYRNQGSRIGNEPRNLSERVIRSLRSSSNMDFLPPAVLIREVQNSICPTRFLVDELPRDHLEHVEVDIDKNLARWDLTMKVSAPQLSSIHLNP